ncbi:hypothetical protein [Streptomyces cucumeris]|uniref:hypothetical protein n=1 Tax=Streptomyces cucumeris TaxID=2962890 RepID=UPI0020C90414|nr:hypothetical protein [Streptomyces sp. NEAU-Y11]MCP9213261.1 hypothetical protein [Streptomyces sp. NEAU-Y11]
MTDIDTLLTEAAPPLHEHRFDAAAGLRRLAQEAGYVLPGPEPGRAQNRLNAVARWWLSRHDAAAHVDQLVDQLNESTPSRGDTTLNVHGAQIFACLLYLTGHPASAQFWWELAAGADVRGAAYCLHLHHIGQGEDREAMHWLLQAQRERDQNYQYDAPQEEADRLDDLFFKTFEQYVSRHDGTRAAPTADLDAEVERLAEREDGGLVVHPDQQLADRLIAFAGRH